MAQPYVGEIRIFAGNFAPVNWMFCEGQLLPILEYEDLFQLIGTTYGGDGQETFALPDLRGRLPMHQGSVYYLGTTNGTEEETLTVSQIPNHNHPLTASADYGQESSPANKVLARSAEMDPYRLVEDTAYMSSQMTAPVGGSQPHSNMQPYLCVNFIISLFGLFPSPT